MAIGISSSFNEPEWDAAHRPQVADALREGQLAFRAKIAELFDDCDGKIEDEYGSKGIELMNKIWRDIVRLPVD